MADDETEPNPSLLPFLQSLKKASKDLQNNSIFITQNPQPAIEALLDLQSQKETIFNPPSSCARLNLSLLLQTLKTLSQKLKTSTGYGVTSLLRRQLSNYRIYRLGFEIEAQVQSFIDREIVRVISNPGSESEDVKLTGLKQFEIRLLQGFDSEFQELILKSKLFQILEDLICDSSASVKLREQSGFCVVALVRFNRDVFVGLILMGSTVQSLISMATEGSIQALCSLIRLIKIPLIDEIELISEIPRIIRLFYSTVDLSIQAAAMDCICEIAYFGRREVIETMIEENLVEKMMELQRLGFEDGEIEEINKPLESCVRRFAVQIEVGEGLDDRERREFKKEILKRVKMASASEAEVAATVADVLWGSSP